MGHNLLKVTDLPLIYLKLVESIIKNSWAGLITWCGCPFSPPRLNIFLTYSAFLVAFSPIMNKRKGCCYWSSQCTHSLVCCKWPGFVSTGKHRQGAEFMVAVTPAEHTIPPEPPPSALTPAQGARAAAWRFLQFYFHRLSLGTRLEFCHISCSWGCHYWLSCFHTFWHRNAGGCRSRGWPILSCLQKRHRERNYVNWGFLLLIYSHHTLLTGSSFASEATMSQIMPISKLMLAFETWQQQTLLEQGRRYKIRVKLAFQSWGEAFWIRMS